MVLFPAIGTFRQYSLIKLRYSRISISLCSILYPVNCVDRVNSEALLPDSKWGEICMVFEKFERTFVSFKIDLGS